MSVRRLGHRVLAIVLALAFATILALAAIEIWVRWSWDVRRGTPGFYVSDAVLGQRLGENYDGWFAGVPVHVNRLGLRDPREYDLAKKPNTFRILVLGDSITFGHGCVFETTYPYLLEQRLKAWTPAVDWQVWNAAVPGYNTAQELEQLRRLGPRFQPDLVVVGFYENDLIDNRPPRQPGIAYRLAIGTLSFARRHLYSIELYRRVYYEAVWRLSASDDYRRRLVTLADDRAASFQDLSVHPGQRLSPYELLSDEEWRSIQCTTGATPSPDIGRIMEREPGFGDWMDAVRGFETLQREGRYRIAFFLNIVPRACPGVDVFYDGTRYVNQYFVQLFSKVAPTVSGHDAFLRARPSQMPNATGHAFGNSNALKADVLFQYLKEHVLPSALPHAESNRAPRPAPPPRT